MPATKKRCVRCKGQFPPTLAFFYAHPATADGMFSKCKSCVLKDRSEAKIASRRQRFGVYFSGTPKNA